MERLRMFLEYSARYRSASSRFARLSDLIRLAPPRRHPGDGPQASPLDPPCARAEVKAFRKLARGAPALRSTSPLAYVKGAACPWASSLLGDHERPYVSIGARTATRQFDNRPWL